MSFPLLLLATLQAALGAYRSPGRFVDAPLADVQSRLKLLSASLAKSGKADEWMAQRIAVLKLLASTRAAEAEDKQEL